MIIISATSREVDAFLFSSSWPLETAHLWLCEYQQKTLRVERIPSGLLFVIREPVGGVAAQPVTGKSDNTGVTAFAQAGALGLVTVSHLGLPSGK